MSPVGLVLGSEANHLQAGTTSHQVCSSRGTEGPGPVSGRSPCICGAAGRKAGSFLLWVSESQCLTRAGRPRSGQDQSLPCPERVPEHPASLQESQQEASPLLLEARQEVRRRIQRPSVPASLEVQNPEESIWARAWRRFLGFLQSLLQRCSDVLTWLREKAAAILEAICSAVEAIWGLLSHFRSKVGQLLRSLIQV